MFWLFSTPNQVFTAESEGPAVGGNTSRGRMGIPRAGRARSAQAVSLSSSQILLQGNSSSLFLQHCLFEILTTPRIRAERIRHINKRPCPAWTGRWVISPRSLSLLRYSTCTALLSAEPHCSCWLAPEQHWASRTFFCGQKEGWRLWANKSILVRSQIQSCPSSKKQWYAQCKSHQALKASLPGSQQRTAPRQQCCSHSHMPAWRADSFVWTSFLFPKQLGHRIFNCCYYSSLDWSRFLILKKYLPHCLLSQHERGGSCGTFCIVWGFFIFPLWVMH